METQYRIKKEALPFFDNKFASKIYSLPTWMGMHIPKQALEEVSDCFVSYGIKKENDVTILCGWDSKNQTAHFDFTVHFLNCSNEQYNYINTNDKVHILMDRLTAVAKQFYNTNQLF